MSIVSEKFATQVDSVLLNSARKLAKSEGHQVQAWSRMLFGNI
jgi:hypothetical protein